jgi:tripartite-type tricarboxylate transporter receptor subunit TctC
MPIGLMGEQPFFIAVASSLGVNTLPELIALAKKRPACGYVDKTTAQFS